MLALTKIRITRITAPPELFVVVMCHPPLPELQTPNLLLRHLGRNYSYIRVVGKITGITARAVIPSLNGDFPIL